MNQLLPIKYFFHPSQKRLPPRVRTENFPFFKTQVYLIMLYLTPSAFFLNTGSVVAQGCPSGQFSNAEKQTDASDCQPCTPGSYCAGEAISEPTGLCFDGYYCVQESDTPRQNACSTGNFNPIYDGLLRGIIRLPSLFEN